MKKKTTDQVVKITYYLKPQIAGTHYCKESNFKFCNLSEVESVGSSLRIALDRFKQVICIDNGALALDASKVYCGLCKGDNKCIVVSMIPL